MAAPPRAPRPPLLTEEEKRERLEGYFQVPPDYWAYVQYSTHVRYINKEGEFFSGGFVLKNPFDVKPQGGDVEKRFIKLMNGFNKAAREHKEWIVAYEDIEFFYAKGSGIELALQQDLRASAEALNGNIKKVAEYCKKLEKRIARLEG